MRSKKAFFKDFESTPEKTMDKYQHWKAMISVYMAVLLVMTSCFSSPNEFRELQGVVIIVLDTVRFDHLSCYGYGRQTSPNLSILAGKGVLFENAISSAPWTLPAMVGMFSADIPSSRNFDNKLKCSMVESLQQAGISTAGITEGGFVSSHFGFDLGFDYYVDGDNLDLSQMNGSNVQTTIPDPEGRIEDTFHKAEEWLAAHKHENFFLFIHTYEPHAPYTRKTFTRGMTPGAVGETFQTKTLNKLQRGEISFNREEIAYLKALYDGGIQKSDTQIGKLIAHLDSLGLSDKTLIVVTSDHGEELGEHYASFAGDHGHSVFDELIRVPLIIYNPCNPQSGRRIESQVRLLDLMPSVLDCLGVQPMYSAMGKSLVPLMSGLETKDRLALGGATKVGPERIFIRWLGYKMIRVVNPKPKGMPLKPLPPPVALYDLYADPEETTDISAQKPEIVNDMMGFLFQLQKSGIGGERFSIPEKVDRSVRERLEALGYIR
ncbi:MAG: sulfatase [Planctomycetota bacterium]